MANTTWQPNEKQKLFIKTLEESGKDLTLAQASKIAGVEFKSGTTNTLLTKKLVESIDTEIECNIVSVETNEILGHTKKKVKAYHLVQKD